VSDPSLDFSRLRRYSLAERRNLVAAADFSLPVPESASARDLVGSIPGIHAGRRFRDLVSAIVAARRAGAPVLCGIGPHVQKCGLSPLVIDLMERSLITGIAMNGAGAIHDYEIALIGATSEDVGESLRDGSFGMARETAEFVGDSARAAAAKGAGLGGEMGRAILAARLPYVSKSVLAAGARLAVPVTVHVALGTDTVHMHPEVDGASLGAASLADFREFCASVSRLQHGVYLNVGSAVILPEIFLKALAVARNLGSRVDDFTTANLDQIQHYRPRVNVLERPGEKGIALTGHHEILLPLLRFAVIAEFADTAAGAGRDPGKGTVR
jgi:hypothetical protein